MPVMATGSTFSETNLLNILALKEIQPPNKRISKIEYKTRRQILTDKLTKILNILKLNYWDLVTVCISGAPKNATPISALCAFRRGCINRTEQIAYNYFLEIYSISMWLKLIDIMVLDNIEYDELSYE